jgi:hypothetical protein
MFIFDPFKCVVALDPASGSSLDWVRGNLGAPYAYVWELRDTGRYGFLLPANQIIDTGEETLNSVIVILQEAKRNLQGNTKR